MNIKPSLLIGIIAAVILISLLTKCSSSHSLNLYKNSVTTSVTTTWDKATTSGTMGEAADSVVEAEIPVVVVYKDVKVGDLDRADALRIDLSNHRLGSFSTPLIKRASFRFTATCQNRRIADTDSTHRQTDIHGAIIVSGKYRFFGFISRDEARRVVARHVLNVVYRDAKRQLN